MRRLPAAIAASLGGLLMTAAPALACAALIGPNGDVRLLRTTTFAGYHEGVEHYVTAFQYAGGGTEFGAITPLPGVPTSVEKGGDWTLQRLVLETEPQVFAALRLGAVEESDGVEVLMTARIDALDITVLRGGGAEVAAWASEQGFRLPPDAPEVLDFYSQRSPIFLAAAFDAEAAVERGQAVGDGTAVHITIPTSDPWVPLRILALGRDPEDRVEADVYLLTDQEPAMLPEMGSGGLSLRESAPASDSLLADLRSDRGMAWVPDEGWLSKVVVDEAAGELRYDLAVDASGRGRPSRVAAGLDPAGGPDAAVVWLLPALALAVTGGSLLGARRGLREPDSASR